MHQLELGFAFLAMILAPCLTSINTGYDGHEGLDEEEEPC